MGKLFGTDGIRGVANEELTPDLAYRTGQIAGELLKGTTSKDRGFVLLGRDTRQSGEMLSSAIMAGLMSIGLDVVDLGIIPTPGVAYLVKRYKANFGVVISASHNPFMYNGIKIFSQTGYKLPDRIEEEIEKHILDRNYCPRLSRPEEVGVLRRDICSKEEYEDYLRGLLDVSLKGVKVALDIGNGALHQIAERVLRGLGAEVFVIHDNPDGKNINHNCGSTNPEKIQKLVVEKKADIGFSFDGDADRIIAVDERGRIIDGDHILAICATYLKEKKQLVHNTVVGTVMTNIGLDRYLDSIGVDLVKTKVGDRYVLEEMKDKNYVLGGEQSGHIIFSRYNTTGDGLATGIHLLEVMKVMSKTMGELNDLMVSYPQVLINAKVHRSKKMAYLEHEEIQSAIERVEKEFSGNGRVVIRPSGTEPLVRVMIEGDDQDKLNRYARELVDLIERELQ